MRNGIPKRHQGEMRFGATDPKFDDSVKTYQMSEEEMKKRMQINPANYVELKEEGLSDAAIAERWDIHGPKLNQKKHDWGFIGKSISDMRAIVKKKMNQKQRNQASASAPTMRGEIHQEAEEKKAEKEELPTVDHYSHLAEEKEESTPAPDTDQTEEIRSLRQELDGIKGHNKEMGQALEQKIEKSQDLSEKLQEAENKLARYQSMELDYESLQKTHQTLTEEHQTLQQELADAQSKQSYVLIEEQLDRVNQKLAYEEEAHRQTKRKLDSAIQNNERLAGLYNSERDRHKNLANYTQMMMPS